MERLLGSILSRGVEDSLLRLKAAAESYGPAVLNRTNQRNG